MFILHEVVFGEKNEEDASSERNGRFTYVYYTPLLLPTNRAVEMLYGLCVS